MHVRLLALAIAVGGLAACGSDASSPTATPGNVYIRSITSVWQTHQRVDTVVIESDTLVDSTYYTPVSMDVMIDSANHAPSMLNIPPNSLSAGSDGPPPGNVAESGYNQLTPGVHSFVLRQAGLTPLGASFFTTSAGTQYLPKIDLFAAPYTVVVFGKLPPPTDTGPALVPADRRNIHIYDPVFDDKFPGPKRVIDGKPVYLAHIILHDYAVFHYRGHGNYLYLTSGTTIQPLSEIVKSQGTDLPQDGNGIDNTIEIGEGQTNGQYVVNVITDDGRILIQQPVTLKYGEVRSFFLVNDLQPGVTEMPGAGPPSPTGYFKLINVLDNQY